MSHDPRRDWTVIVMRPGHTSQSYQLGPARRALLTGLLIMVPLATAVLGYLLGIRQPNAPPTAPRSAGAEANPAPTPEPQATGPATSPSDGGTPADAGAEAADLDAEDDAVTTVAEAREALAVGPALALQLDAGGGRILKVHPFTSDGEVIREAFSQLADALACEEGRPVPPSTRLVKVLLATHERFAQPLWLRGGLCGIHADDDDHARATHQHGQAADVRMLGVSTGRLMGFLTENQPLATAVGRYRHRGFVHVGVGPGERAVWEADPPKKAGSDRASQRQDEQRQAEPVAPAPEAPSTSVSTATEDDGTRDGRKSAAAEAPATADADDTSPGAEAASATTATTSDTDAMDQPAKRDTGSGQAPTAGKPSAAARLPTP